MLRIYNVIWDGQDADGIRRFSAEFLTDLTVDAGFLRETVQEALDTTVELAIAAARCPLCFD